MKVNLHNIGEGGVMIFRKDKEHEGKAYSCYSMCFSKPDRNGNPTKKWMRVFFDRDVTVANQTLIYIKRSFLSYDNKDWFLHISEFDVLKTGVERTLEGDTPKVLADDMRFL